MLTTLQEQDTELDYIEETKKDIIESITLEDVKTFLEWYSGITYTKNNEKSIKNINPNSDIKNWIFPLQFISRDEKLLYVPILLIITEFEDILINIY